MDERSEGQRQRFPPSWYRIPQQSETLLLPWPGNFGCVRSGSWVMTACRQPEARHPSAACFRKTVDIWRTRGALCQAASLPLVISTLTHRRAVEEERFWIRNLIKLQDQSFVACNHTENVPWCLLDSNNWDAQWNQSEMRSEWTRDVYKWREHEVTRATGN